MLKMPKRVRLLAIAPLLCATIAPAARADTLTGQSGTAVYDYPSVGTVATCPTCTNEGPTSFTVPQTVDFSTGIPGVPNVVQNVISATGIDISFLVGSNFATAAFNGEVFNFPTFDITGISVTQNMGATVTFDANDIYVNWEGLNYPTTDYVDITVSGQAAATPEPSAVALLCAGILALGTVLLRRKHTFYCSEFN
jgi:hypothetical protein